PVTSFVHAGPQLTADRYGYLATVGVFVLAGAGAVQVAAAGRRSGASGADRSRRWRTLVVGSGVTAALLASAGLTWRQQAVWADVGSLWAAAARATPECVLCHVSWANWLANHERYEEAAAEYTRALELAPDLVQTHEYIGLALVRLGRAEEALPHYEAALAAAPARVGLRLGYARALVAAGRRAEAVAVLEHARTHGAAGALVDYFREVAEREPRAAVARAGLAQAYAWAGQHARARAVHARLAELDPELARLVAGRLPPEARAGGRR
ncbi:MAG TPA: tetratricopeptide repeat protein, partial [Methylomirabilota bacterium]|nr:tetratricopeptide repeat protein [Methylomirabilota bacterium]